LASSKARGLFFCFIFLSDFQSGFSKEWQRVYLATPPRSGNHWIRYLVEEAAHIATSAVYRDKVPQHLKKIFPWGGYCCDHGYEGHCRYPTKEEFVLIKTHFPDSQETQFDRRPYQMVIRIVRHPVDSFYSRYVKNPRGPLLDKVPSEKVREFIPKWRRFQLYWNDKKHIMTFRYEDILQNPAPALKTICEVLHYDVTDEDIARAIAKHPPEGYLLKHIDKFSTEDLHLISKELGDLMEQFDYQIPL
jgi:hypothetical protein